MKTKLLFLIFGLAMATICQGQQLNYTAWKGMLFTFPDTATQVFANGILTTTSPTILVISRYTEEGDTLTIKDIGGLSGCDSIFKGIYTFQIVNNTITYTLVSDIGCPGRANALNGSVMYSIPYLGDPELSLPEMAVFPNPSSDGIFNCKLQAHELSYRVFSTSGQLLSAGEVPRQTRLSLDLSRFGGNMFYLEVIKQGASPQWLKLLSVK